MIERVSEQMRKLGRRADGFGECPVCGRAVTHRHRPVRAWSGKYAHGKCASYIRASRRGQESSRRLHSRFTTP